MPTAPPAIFTPAGSGGTPSAPPTVFTPAGSGGSPTAPPTVFTPAGSGGSPTAPPTIFTPAGSGGSPTAPPTVFTPAGSGGSPTAPPTVFTPAGSGGSPTAPPTVFTPAGSGGSPSAPPTIFTPSTESTGPASFDFSDDENPGRDGHYVYVGNDVDGNPIFARDSDSQSLVDGIMTGSGMIFIQRNLGSPSYVWSLEDGSVGGWEYSPVTYMSGDPGQDSRSVEPTPAAVGEWIGDALGGLVFVSNGITAPPAIYTPA